MEIKDIIAYHQRSKHHFNRYARSLGYLDWDNQPNPFRFYEQTPRRQLPLLASDPELSHLALYRQPKQPPASLSKENIGAMLELSLGLSAWKSIGASRWSLRMNPSSGNLHPTEAYLLLPELADIESGVYHYASFLHALELRARIPVAKWQVLQQDLGANGFAVALTSIFWRESWKYGERAFRYCNHDVGHAMAALRFAANLLGWRIFWLADMSDDQIGRCLGLDQGQWPAPECEHPDLFCVVHCGDKIEHQKAYRLSAASHTVLENLTFAGRPNTLSRQHQLWPAIDAAARCSQKAVSDTVLCPTSVTHPILGPASDLSAARIIRQRRSATAFNPQGQLDRERFMALLDKTMPRQDGAPFDLLPSSAEVHLLLFVHRVADLTPGLYFLNRNTDHDHELRRCLKPDFVWQRVTQRLPLFLLRAQDVQDAATRLCCHQEIAGLSAFAVGMIARFAAVVEKTPYRYRHLFWETGIIGQVLYLEAESQGVRGTGIGCYFDDGVHDLIGLKDLSFQSLYHFTVGQPVEDRRLTTHAPYHHLER